MEVTATMRRQSTRTLRRGSELSELFHWLIVVPCLLTFWLVQSTVAFVCATWPILLAIAGIGAALYGGAMTVSGATDAGQRLFGTVLVMIGTFVVTLIAAKADED